MTLSQRLTRAGLTFILLGTVAAILPQVDTAQASTTDCVSGTTIRYRLTDNSTGADSNSVNIAANGGTDTLYTFQSTDGGATFQQYGAALTITPGNTANFSGSSSASTTATTGATVTATNTGTGSNTVTADFTGTGGSASTTFAVNVQ